MWLRWQDSNLRIRESKTRALTAWRHLIIKPTPRRVCSVPTVTSDGFRFKHWVHIGLPVHQGLLLPWSMLMSGAYFPLECPNIRVGVNPQVPSV